jgi:chemotaxis protein CheD
MNTDINLQAGEAYFGKAPKRIKTLLGSCVAVTVWHSELKLGGLCHYLISERKDNTNSTKSGDYKYGKQALAFLKQQMVCNADLKEYEVGIYGGSNMYNSESSSTIGEKNVSYAHQWLKQLGLNAKNEDVLGEVCRTLILDLSTGDVHLKRYQQVNKNGR